MKYLIVKGWLGFGDRLESLKMCVAYAQKYNLQIYVDWRDSMWSHGENDFYTYFKLVNMPVLNSLSDIPASATFYPSFWKDCLEEQITNDFIYKHKDDGIQLNLLDKPYDADVVVYSCTGARTLYPDSSFFANVFRVIDQRILDKVNYHKSKFPVENAWGVHIRGTDRMKRQGRRLMGMQAIVSHFTSMGGLNISHILAVSDDRENLNIWKNFYPSTYVVSDLGIQTNVLDGNHYLTKDKLSTSKDMLNVDLLTDFFILSMCRMIFSTVKDSRFGQEARRLHPYINTILYGNK